jgi:pilus assembly protein CpaE
MSELTVAVIASEEDQRAILKMMVDGTAVARCMQTLSAYPAAATDPLLRRLKDLDPDVVIYDVPGSSAAQAVKSIEVLHIEMPRTAIVAVGEMTQPHIIVQAMRAGGREYLERPTSVNSLLDAFLRLSSMHRKSDKKGERGKIVAVINAKGGSGATTIAVNTALSLQARHGSTLLVDLASLGHTALHMNLKPAFTLADALHNLNRLDSVLLDTFVTRHNSGVSLLAGFKELGSNEGMGPELARLFDVVVGVYRYVVVDLSSRLDGCARLVSELADYVLLIANMDVPSLWSAHKIREYLNQTASSDKIRIVLNRYKKIPGLDDADVETATHSKIMWKIPNQFPAISTSIERGIPVAHVNHTDIARSFGGLVELLTPREPVRAKTAWSLLRSS